MIKHVKRSFIAIIGSFVLVVGIIMIPYPGPGWLVVFAGLGILATEFEFAQHILEFAKSKYEAWNKWVASQKVIVRALIWLSTVLVVVVTIWLMNGYGIANHLLNLDWNWLDSPLPIFH